MSIVKDKALCENIMGVAILIVTVAVVVTLGYYYYTVPYETKDITIITKSFESIAFAPYTKITDLNANEYYVSPDVYIYEIKVGKSYHIQSRWNIIHSYNFISAMSEV